MNIQMTIEITNLQGLGQSYKTGVKKVANWSICRIPCSGDLDWGAAEFSPAPEYRKYGWEDYKP